MICRTRMFSWTYASGILDLIPTIEHCQEDRTLVLDAVKVLGFLTLPVEPTSNDIFQQIEFLWELTSSITSSDIVEVIVSLLESPLENLERSTGTTRCCLNIHDWVGGYQLFGDQLKPHHFT